MSPDRVLTDDQRRAWLWETLHNRRGWFDVLMVLGLVPIGYGALFEIARKQRGPWPWLNVSDAEVPEPALFVAADGDLAAYLRDALAQGGMQSCGACSS